MTRWVVGLLVAAAGLTAAPAQAQVLPEVFKRVKDSVVVIRTESRDLSPWPGGEQVSVGGLGSGVLVHPDGIILTAAHVIQTAEKIEVLFSDGATYEARVFSSEPSADIAAIKLTRIPSGRTVAPLADSDKVEVGDEIFVVGAPHGISYTMTVGHISARRIANQVWGGLSQAELFQTDAAINTGNSGGPMFNLDGEVVGIVSSMISRSGSFEGLGFVVTSNMAKLLVLQQRSMWSGMDGFALTGDLARIFNLPQPMGVLVQRVADNSPARRLGLRGGSIRAQIAGQELILGGDIILGVEGIRLADPASVEKIRQYILGLTPGEELTLNVLRGGQQVNLKGKPIDP